MGKRAANNDVSAALKIFGSQMALFRQRMGLTQAQLGERLGYSKSQIESVEQGRRVPRPEFITKAEEVLNAGGVLEISAPHLKDARFPARFQDIADIEASAVSLYSYECQLIPGLLQTEDTARALLRAHCPPLEDETIEERVAARMERQALLTRRPPLVLGFVIEETVLRRPVGGAGVLKDQLLRLLEVGEYRNVSIQIMPMSRDAHVGLNGPMLLLETAERETLAYTEVQGVSTVVTDRDEVSVLAQRYGIIRARALGTEESAQLIEQLAGAL